MTLHSEVSHRQGNLHQHLPRWIFSEATFAVVVLLAGLLPPLFWSNLLPSSRLQRRFWSGRRTSWAWMEYWHLADIGIVSELKILWMPWPVDATISSGPQCPIDCYHILGLVAVVKSALEIARNVWRKRSARFVSRLVKAGSAKDSFKSLWEFGEALSRCRLDRALRVVCHRNRDYASRLFCEQLHCKRSEQIYLMLVSCSLWSSKSEQCKCFHMLSDVKAAHQRNGKYLKNGTCLTACPTGRLEINCEMLESFQIQTCLPSIESKSVWKSGSLELFMPLWRILSAKASSKRMAKMASTAPASSASSVLLLVKLGPRSQLGGEQTVSIAPTHRCSGVWFCMPKTTHTRSASSFKTECNYLYKNIYDIYIYAGNV